MTEKKAKELFAQYMKAETAGDDALAVSLEKQLNDAGWYITSGEDGLTVQKKSSISLPTIDPSLIPQDTKVTPIRVDQTQKDTNPNRKIWIAIGITAGFVAVTIVVVILIKRYKNGNS